jgi:competence protein ComEA
VPEPDEPHEPHEHDLRASLADPPSWRERLELLTDPPSWRERLQLVTDPPSWTPGRLAAAAVALLVAVGAVVLVLRPPAGSAPEVTLPRAGTAADPAPTTTTAPPAVVAHAAGAVQAPGVYRLEPGARAGDLVAAAGGAAPDADLQQLNLAAPVADGERVYVPRVGEVAPPPVAGATGGGPAGEGAADGPVNLNTATAEQLEELPGVGPAIAAAILDERERRGRFATVDDLLDVRGIGDARLEQLRDLVTV